jgi:hypothetical protein
MKHLIAIFVLLLSPLAIIALLAFSDNYDFTPTPRTIEAPDTHIITTDEWGGRNYWVKSFKHENDCIVFSVDGKTHTIPKLRLKKIVEL